MSRAFGSLVFDRLWDSVIIVIVIVAVGMRGFVLLLKVLCCDCSSQALVLGLVALLGLVQVALAPPAAALASELGQAAALSNNMKPSCTSINKHPVTDHTALGIILVS